jgi:hypothetical protein
LSENSETVEPVEAEAAAPEAPPVAVETVEAPVEDAPEAAAEAAPEEAPVAEVEEAVAQVSEPIVEDSPVPEEVASVAVTTVAQARVFLCERGHRVTALWNTPTVCQGRITRSGALCGRTLYAIDDLPETVQKALNPLKASKKSSKKK